MNITIALGQKQLVHPNPVKADGTPIAMPADYALVVADPSICAAPPGIDGGGHFVDLTPVAVGVTTVTFKASKPDGTLVSEVLNVTVVAAVVIGFDHFEPIADPPRFA